MICLDTNALIRFFTDDDHKKASLVAKLLEKEKEIIIPEVVFPEIEYVLQGVYKSNRSQIIDIFKFLTSRSNIKLNQIVKKAVTLFEQTSLDMADCLIVSHSLKGRLASFDDQLVSVKGVRRYW